MKVKSLSRVRLVATPWTAAYQALQSTGFSRQEDLGRAKQTKKKKKKKKERKGLNLFTSSEIIKDQNYKSLESQSRCLDIKVILKSQLHFYILTANN